mmetsp:Transcript_16736/g.45927  ORF Transcript_16736/g.45927 Transcript_16736/m.45927 type:complete len:115 (+) Transcript_16736:129-473(+)
MSVAMPPQFLSSPARNRPELTPQSTVECWFRAHNQIFPALRHPSCFQETTRLQGDFLEFGARTVVKPDYKLDYKLDDYTVARVPEHCQRLRCSYPSSSLSTHRCGRPLERHILL